MSTTSQIKSKLYILADARFECLRKAADEVASRGWTKKTTHYFRATHSTIGDMLQRIEPVENDDVIIAVPLVDAAQKEDVNTALAAFSNSSVNIYWYYGPKWFDCDKSVSGILSKIKLTASNSSVPISGVNEYYKDDGSIDASDLAAYIDYRLMYLFMKVDTDESTFEAIISAVSSCCKKTEFKLPAKPENMANILKRYKENRPSMAGRSNVFEEYKKRIVTLARLDKEVLIVGETGTGKEATAYYLHEFSPRRSKNFLAINCACYTEELLNSELFGHVKGSFSGAATEKKGLVETIDGGTLFLDEIPDTSPRVQAMLLRFIQSGEYSPVGSNVTKKVDVKIVAGAQPGLLHKLRDDLRFRLEEQIRTYSLRGLNTIHANHPDGGKPDIISMARNLAANSIGKPKVPLQGFMGFEFEQARVTHKDIVTFWAEIARQDIIDLFTSYNWPGNVRELQTCISRHLCENIPLAKVVKQLRDGSTEIQRAREVGKCADTALVTRENVQDALISAPHKPVSLTAATEERCEAVSCAGTYQEPQDIVPAIQAQASHQPVSFAGITKAEELIPAYEVENLYYEHVRTIITAAELKQNRKVLIEKLELSINTYNDYIINGVKKERQRKGSKSDSTEITESSPEIKTPKKKAR